MRAHFAAPLATLAHLPPASTHQLLTADLIVTFGGDGTLLATIRDLRGAKGAFFGVKLVGTLGFLTCHDPALLADDLATFAAGKCSTEHRVQLRADILRGGTPIASLTALNEVVIHQKNSGRMMALPVTLDDRSITDYLADGVIFATPTGSTAYSLSCGGPILYPSMETLLITPISPHLLATRPLLLPAHRTITATITEKTLRITADGQVTHTLKQGDIVRIARDTWSPLFAYLPERNYFDVLREKLSFGRRNG